MRASISQLTNLARNNFREAGKLLHKVSFPHLADFFPVNYIWDPYSKIENTLHSLCKQMALSLLFV
jgi:hypothetical protein